MQVNNSTVVATLGGRPGVAYTLTSVPNPNYATTGVNPSPYGLTPNGPSPGYNPSSITPQSMASMPSSNSPYPQNFFNPALGLAAGQMPVSVAPPHKPVPWEVWATPELLMLATAVRDTLAQAIIKQQQEFPKDDFTADASDAPEKIPISADFKVPSTGLKKEEIKDDKMATDTPEPMQTSSTSSPSSSASPMDTSSTSTSPSSLSSSSTATSSTSSSPGLPRQTIAIPTTSSVILPSPSAHGVMVDWTYVSRLLKWKEYRSDPHFYSPKACEAQFVCIMRDLSKLISRTFPSYGAAATALCTHYRNARIKEIQSEMTKVDLVLEQCQKDIEKSSAPLVPSSTPTSVPIITSATLPSITPVGTPAANNVPAVYSGLPPSAYAHLNLEEGASSVLSPTTTALALASETLQDGSDGQTTVKTEENGTETGTGPDDSKRARKRQRTGADSYEEKPHVPPPAASGVLTPDLDQDTKAKSRYQMLGLWDRITVHEDAEPFMYPVRLEDAPRYDQVIKVPMDFTTIRRKIEEELITTTQDFFAHMALVYANACKYNTRKTVIFKMAKALQAFTVSAFKEEFPDDASTFTLDLAQTVTNSESADTEVAEEAPAPATKSNKRKRASRSTKKSTRRTSKDKKVKAEPVDPEPTPASTRSTRGNKRADSTSGTSTKRGNRGSRKGRPRKGK